MKLIKKASDKKKLNKVECDYCGSIYSCLKEELKFVADARDGAFYWFTCPGCKARSAIAGELIK